MAVGVMGREKNPAARRDTDGATDCSGVPRVGGAEVAEHNDIASAQRTRRLSAEPREGNIRVGNA
jgi:hypothetical protein